MTFPDKCWQNVDKTLSCLWYTFTRELCTLHLIDTQDVDLQAYLKMHNIIAWLWRPCMVTVYYWCCYWWFCAQIYPLVIAILYPWKWMQLQFQDHHIAETWYCSQVHYTVPVCVCVSHFTVQHTQVVYLCCALFSHLSCSVSQCCVVILVNPLRHCMFSMYVLHRASVCVCVCVSHFTVQHTQVVYLCCVLSSHLSCSVSQCCVVILVNPLRHCMFSMYVLHRASVCVCVCVTFHCPTHTGCLFVLCAILSFVLQCIAMLCSDSCQPITSLYVFYVCTTPWRFLNFMGRGAHSKWFFRMSRSCPIDIVFPPHFFKMVVEVTAFGPPHVLRLWSG